MKLLKFGGTSLANAEKFLSVADIIEKNMQTEQIAIVLSAPAKITNYLINIIEKTIKNNKIDNIINLAENMFIQLIQNIKKIQHNFTYHIVEKIIQTEFKNLKKIVYGISLLKQCPENIRAIIISRGEILSVLIMKNILKSRGHSITIINPIENFLSIGNSYLDSTINIIESKKRVQKLTIDANNIILMAGFIAGNQEKKLVLLGRNGSDYSAAILSVCLNVNFCEIWTDVDGVFTCDPREVSNPYLLKSISYEEAMELAYFGAKILHPRTIAPLAQFNIPCLIKNTNNIDSGGTVICKQDNTKEKYLKGITHLDNITMFNISGSNINYISNMTSRIFDAISKKNIKVILITQSSSENKINFCISENEIDSALLLLNKEFQLELKNKLLNPFKIIKNLSILSVIGSNIYKKSNIASKIFYALGSSNINIIAIAQGSSKHSISLVIKKTKTLQSIKNIHNILFDNKKIIHVFLIGIGGIGQTLLKQISKQKLFLYKKNIEIKICVIANSKKMLMSDNVLDLSDWKINFKNSKKVFNLKILHQIIQKNNLINSVIVDCTSDQLLSEQYLKFLQNNFHVVTSNKKANTHTWKYYNKIRQAAHESNKKFLYETNIGAGLPIIETIQNLFKTGDKIIHFKGILSGSLSFIFGKLEDGIPLSEAVKEAKKLGFTEPNPCDDLLGTDIARKLLILAREVGHKIEMQDIHIDPLLPEKFKKYQNVNEFLLKLKKLDSYFLKKSDKARSSGNVLRFIGTMEKTGKCFVKLEEINTNDPLYKIKNGENAFVFYTNYYQPIPLLLRGYGAGNNVTASGVFSDLLRTL